MGGNYASGDINAAVDTYVMLAEGTGDAEGVTGKYWYRTRTRTPKEDAEDRLIQDKLIQELEGICGISPDFE